MGNSHATDEQVANPVRGQCANPDGRRYGGQRSVLRRGARVQERGLGQRRLHIREPRWRRIYLCRGGQGQAGTWVWIGVEDVATLYEEYQASGANIRQPPENFPWAYEMKVEDPDGHVLRFGSEPRPDLPFAAWSG